MTEQQAKERGLQFTGIYVRSFKKDEATGRANKINKSGYKAAVVRVPDSKLSRDGGGGHGYSVYAEEKYFKDLDAEDMRKSLTYIPQRLETVARKYEQDVAEIKADEAAMIKWLKDNGYSAQSPSFER